MNPNCPAQQKAEEEAINRKINYIISAKDSYFEDINPDQSYMKHMAEQLGYTPPPQSPPDDIIGETLPTITTISSDQSSSLVNSGECT
jgi:hypothetical protein